MSDEHEPRDAEQPADHDGDRPAGQQDGDDALLSRLRVIEDQPLAERATAYSQVHDELRQRLEAGDHS